MLFANWKLIWRSYTFAKALSTIKQIKINDKKEFAKATLNANSKTFVMYIADLKVLLAKMTIYLSQAGLITNVDSIQLVALQQNETYTKIQSG